MGDSQEHPFDPLRYENVARTVVSALLERPLYRLTELEPFSGCGIYAIYYTGSFNPYRTVTTQAGVVPIYVGKAVPSGSRKGTERSEPSRTRALCNRLRQHAKTLEAAQNLALSDFLCRHLTVETVWIRLAERVLLDRFHPVWNSVVDGFGNHPPGRGRRNMRRPRWDIVHPGRSWALELEPEESAEDILGEVRRHLAVWGTPH